MTIIRNRAELESYIQEHNIPMPAGGSSKYESLLDTWRQEEVIEKDSLKGRIKGSFFWSVLKVFLPVYRVLRRLWRDLRYVGIRKTMQRIGNRISNIGCFRIARGRKVIAAIMPDETERVRQQNESCEWDACISILVPLYNTPKRYLKDMIESVQAQTYSKWQLCMADGSDADHSEVEAVCMEYQKKDSRITYKKLEENVGIAGNTNACIEMAEGEYIAFFDHDDMLHPAALYECMKAVREQGAEFVYTDELTFKGGNLNNIVTKHYKPDYSPENLRGVNYICHLSIFKKSLLEKTGLLDDTYNGSQDHDIILKLTSAAHVVHISKLLYFWRVHPGSVSMDIGAKEYAIEAGRNAVRDQEHRLGRNAEVVSSRICATHYRLAYEIAGEPLVSIAIIGQAQDKVSHLLGSIYAKTTYANYEILMADTPEAALAEGNGAYYVFLSSDMETIMPDWIQMLLMYVQREDVGIAAGRILTPNGTVREAGYIIGLDDRKMVTPIGEGESYEEPGYMSRMYYVNNVSACSVNGAMMKKETAGMLAEADTVQFRTSCYKGLLLSNAVREAGKSIVVNPYVLFVKGAADMPDETELERVQAHFACKADPYYNPNLSRDGQWKA